MRKKHHPILEDTIKSNYLQIVVQNSLNMFKIISNNFELVRVVTSCSHISW